MEASQADERIRTADPFITSQGVGADKLAVLRAVSSAQSSSDRVLRNIGGTSRGAHGQKQAMSDGGFRSRPYSIMNIPPNEAWGESPEAALLLWSVKGFPMDEARQWNALQLHEVAAWLLSQRKPLTDVVAERIEVLADQAVQESGGSSSTRGIFAAIVEMIRRLAVPFECVRVK